MSESHDQSCPICEGLMFGVHCKLICRNCGYKEDCSDLFPHRPPEPPAARGQHASPPGSRFKAAEE
jgi:hypothetical protein